MMMKIGIIGKPNVGKTTLFNALTLSSEKTGNYPFTTIEGTEGVTYVRIKCVCRELNVVDNPNNSFCRDGWRFIPIKIIDTAGLVPDAWKGRGLGNMFLSKIMETSGLIHVIDISGSTDMEGNPIEPGSHDPLEDIHFIKRELHMWIKEIIEKHVSDIEKMVKFNKVPLNEALFSKLSGLSITKEHIEVVIKRLNFNSIRDIHNNLDIFIETILSVSKPIIYGGNKIDIPVSKKNLARIRNMGIDIFPISALSEYLLRTLDRDGKIDYIPGDSHFKILDTKDLTPREKRALEYIDKKIFRVWGGTGVQKIIDHLVFKKLDYIAVYPVKDIHKLTDGEGRVLPDVYLIRKGSTLRDLAGLIHTELGERIKYGFVYGVNTRVSPDYLLKHRDIVSIQIY